MKSLLELIKILYGPKAISSTLGTRTNIVRLPTGKLQRYLKEDLNIEMASDNAAINAYKEMRQLISDVPKMNDGERLVFEGNLRRLKNKLEASNLIPKQKVIKEGEVVKMETKEQVTGKDLESLVEEAGLMAPPTTPIGETQLKLKQVEQGLKDILKNKTNIDDILKDPIESQIRYAQLQRSGLVRAVAREIIEQDIKAGKLKLRPAVEKGMISPTGSGLDGDPIEVYRLYYGEDALEQLDSLTPEFNRSRTAKDAAKIAREKYPTIQPREKPIREYLTPNEVDEMTKNLKEGRKAEQEFEINKPAKVSDFKAETTKRTSIDDLIDEYNANQDRLRLSDEEGGTAIGYEEFQQLRKRNEDIAKALEDKGISSKVEETPQGEIILFRKKPTEPEGKADGGRIGYAQGTSAMGLDYLTGMVPSEGYADGGRIGFKVGGGKKILDLIAEANKKLKGKKSMETVDPKTGEVTTPKEPVTTADKITRRPTKEEYEEYAEILDDSENFVVQGNETFEQLNALVKKQKDFEDYMFMQYKRGKLDPVAGEKTQDRMKFLQKKLDRRLISFNELKELDELFTNFIKENDPKGFKKIQKIVDDINNKNMLKDFDVTGRKPNAKGGIVRRENYKLGSMLKKLTFKDQSGAPVGTFIDFFKYVNAPQTLSDSTKSVFERYFSNLAQSGGLSSVTNLENKYRELIKGNKVETKAKGGSVGLDYLTGK